MFFIVSKIAYSLIAPSNICLGLIGIGLLLGFWEKRRPLGWRLAVGGYVLLIALGFSPIGKWIAKPLEDRFAGVEAPAAKEVSHIILLGGFEQALIARERGQITTNAAAERLLAIPVLARRYPNALIVFSGGHGWLLGERLSAVKIVTRFLVDAGVPRARLRVEGQARNTWQNAKHISALLKADGFDCPCGFALVTSSWHMPRAMGVFRKAGFDADGNRLHPMPVDYRTIAGAHLWSSYSWSHEGLKQTDIAVKEWIGLFVYWLSGRTDSLWPQPRPR